MAFILAGGLLHGCCPEGADETQRLPCWRILVLEGAPSLEWPGGTVLKRKQEWETGFPLPP